MKTVKKYDLTHLLDSQIVLSSGGHDMEENRRYLFPCSCGTPTFSISYLHNDQETNAKDVEIYFHASMEKITLKSRWKEFRKYLFEDRIEVGMGASASLDLEPMKRIIDVLDGFVKFMEGNFKTSELSSIPPRVVVRKFVNEGKTFDDDPFIGESFVLEPIMTWDEDSIYLTREKKHLLVISFYPDSGLYDGLFDVSWTLPFNIKQGRKIWYAIQYLFGKTSRVDEGCVTLNYQDVKNLLPYLRKVVASAEEYSVLWMFIQGQNYKNTTRLSQKDFDVVMNAINNLSEPNQALKDAMVKYQEMFGKIFGGK